MKTCYLTEERIRRAGSFLRKRRDHAKRTQNKEFVKEFENLITLLEQLTTIKI